MRRFQSAIGKAVGEAWCLSFGQFCVIETDRHIDEVWLQSLPPHGLFPTEHCVTLWKKSQHLVCDPRPGSIILWQKWKNGKPTQSGHAGVVVEVLDHATVKTVEGNTGGGPGVNREGDVVAEKTRSLNGKGSMRVLGCLGPWDGIELFQPQAG